MKIIQQLFCVLVVLILLKALNAEYDIDSDCRSIPCQNNGTCFQYQYFYFCNCSYPYAGAFCEQTNACYNVTCKNGGGCKLVPGDTTTFQCVCPSGYSGTYCELPPVYPTCTNTTCLNNGTCYNQYQSTLCICNGNWTGYNCGINTNVCLSSPCLNGGTCSAIASGFTCICPSGFVGTTCSLPDPCLSNPCYNGAMCIGSSYDNINTMFVCNCISTGVWPAIFNGTLCENTIAWCPNICNSSSTCVRDINYGFDCQGNGYYGMYGDHKKLYCRQACLNGGQCSVNDFLGWSIPYNCWCGDSNNAYIGGNCQFVNPCKSYPCQNAGTCVPSLDDYLCTCSPFWTGKNCDMPMPDPFMLSLNISYCNPNPCQNNGTCVTYGSKYWSCVCNPPYTDRYCGSYNDPCDNPGTCTYNGNCTFTPSINDFDCACFPGYYGEYCDTQTACILGLCPDNTTCKWNGGSFYNITCDDGKSATDDKISFPSTSLAIKMEHSLYLFFASLLFLSKVFFCEK